MGSFKERRNKSFYGPEVRFLKDELQRKFVLRFFSLVILGAVLSGGIIYWKSATTLTTIFDQGRLKITNTADFILPAVILSSTVVIIATSLFLSLVILFIYHRMGQSLRQIEYEVEKADQGDLSDVHLNFRREDDEFKPLASDLNKMIQDLKQILSAAKNDIASLENTCKELKEGDAERKIKQGVQRLKEELSKFHVG